MNYKRMSLISPWVNDRVKFMVWEAQLAASTSASSRCTRGGDSLPPAALLQMCECLCAFMRVCVCVFLM